MYVNDRTAFNRCVSARSAPRSSTHAPLHRSGACGAARRSQWSTRELAVRPDQRRTTFRSVCSTPVLLATPRRLPATSPRGRLPPEVPRAALASRVARAANARAYVAPSQRVWLHALGQACAVLRPAPRACRCIAVSCRAEPRRPWLTFRRSNAWPGTAPRVCSRQHRRQLAPQTALSRRRLSSARAWPRWLAAAAPERFGCT